MGRDMRTTEGLDEILRYHQETKHRLDAYARGPGRLDWTNEPNPFRCYQGSPLIRLDRAGLEEEYKAPAVPLSLHSISQLLYQSLALSAWKRSGASTWSLRVNPSSGDLHPTESYLISGPVKELCNKPSIFHYTPQEHALELRARLPPGLWESMDLPEGSLLLALSSIYWRESWKYGERAFRYCALDAGHASAAISIAAACLGWQGYLQDDLGTGDLARLIGVAGERGEEAEQPDCLMAIYTDGKMHDFAISGDTLSGLDLSLLGKPNALSPEHVSWPIIDVASMASTKPQTEGYGQYGQRQKNAGISPELCHVIRSRRSAQAMDGMTYMEIEAFRSILRLALPGRLPFNTLPWKPLVNLVLFIHRIRGLKKGLYLFLRDDEAESRERLKEAVSSRFSWSRPEGWDKEAKDLELYLLEEGDARGAARGTSCDQDIASDGCLCLTMLAEFEKPLRDLGPWFYPRLHWECGMIGQAMYLGAEVLGLRGCGIGCFLDDEVHRLLGLEGFQYQDLYHFTLGKALEDKRITTIPAYT